MRIAIFLLTGIASAAFIVPANNFFSAKSIQKNYEKTGENRYMCKYEVSNADYREFLAAIPAAEVSRALPDTQVWRGKLHYSAPFIAAYFRHPSFSNYPVVGVSYDQANAYCKWLTDNYNADPKRKFSKALFRLPSKQEWMDAASGGDADKQYPWGNGFVHNSRSMPLARFREDAELQYDSASRQYRTADTNAPRMIITSPVKAFFPNSAGLYNMSGNVAEMVAERGIAKGGSWHDGAWDIAIRSEKTYEAPSAETGFRVLMEVIEK